jgi:NAD(P)-dependent dehydrogenase (short-subunit alcohol dehydrogenase family)
VAEREVVVVTGASGGFGRAVAREFAKHGAAVGLIARGHAGLDAAARGMSELGGTPFAYQADVAEFDEMHAAAAAIEERLGPIDVWINNAMTTVFAFLDDIDPREYERATRVTYLGAVWGTKAALARMLPRDRGTIVQVGSALGYRGIPLQAPYCGAKHAMKGMFESLRCELRHRGSKVHVAMVQLPGMNTPQFDHCLSRMPRHPMWMAERYLARNAIDGQQTDQQIDGSATANLFEPVDDDHDESAHGIFDGNAHRRSEQAWLSRHRLGSGLAATAVAGGVDHALVRVRAHPAASDQVGVAVGDQHVLGTAGLEDVAERLFGEGDVLAVVLAL